MSSNLNLQAAESLHTGQSRVLELIAKDVPLKEVLESLMLLIESQSSGLYCSVLLLDEDGIHIHPSAAPHLPATYMAMLDGIPIGPMSGSCGTAMFRKEMVIVTDVLSDPLWASYKGLIEPHGFRACWSTPIFLNRDVILGSFAMYYKEVRSPGPQELALMGVATHIAGIAIERTLRARELERHRFHLEQLVSARTAELSATNQELLNALATLSATQEELVRRDKLAALGALVAGVAHELNTPIGNSLVAASTLADHTHAFSASYESGMTRSMLEKFLADACSASDLLLRNLQRAANLVSDFKQIATPQSTSQRSKFTLDKLIQEIEKPNDQSGLTLHTDITSHIEIDSYPGPLSDVLRNLINNAIKHGYAGHDTGDIYLTVTSNSTGMELSVRDHGNGIDPIHLTRIFDPFFTTTLGSGNSGLGLYVAHNIVTGILGGQLHVSSTLGQGSIFTISLPLIAP